jgi:hypothetical protein
MFLERPIPLQALTRWFTRFCYAEDVDSGYAPEYLHTLMPNDFLKAKLEFKVGCPVMLLHNLDPS